MARVLIAGCGYVGVALGLELAGQGHEVFGLRRRSGALPDPIRPIEADLALPSSLAELPAGLDAVHFLAAPRGSDDALYRSVYVDGLRNLLAALDAQGQRPRRVFFASSTAVYEQDDGGWVDESTPLDPRSFRGRRLLEAEALLGGGPFASCVVRFGGIYGPRRARLVEEVRRGRAVYRRGEYTNRIHRDDCAGALAHLMGLSAPESLYLGVDCEPAEREAVLTWLAGATGAPPPRPAGRDDPVAARSGNKRCRNDRLLASGYTFRYPTFREGYAAVLADAA